MTNEDQNLIEKNFRMKDYVQRGGTVFEKFKQLDSLLIERFASQRADYAEIHEFELRDMALEIAEEIDLHDFKV